MEALTGLLEDLRTGVRWTGVAEADLRAALPRFLQDLKNRPAELPTDAGSFLAAARSFVLREIFMRWWLHVSQEQPLPDEERKRVVGFRSRLHTDLYWTGLARGPAREASLSPGASSPEGRRRGQAGDDVNQGFADFLGEVALPQRTRPATSIGFLRAALLSVRTTILGSLVAKSLEQSEVRDLYRYWTASYKYDTALRLRKARPEATATDLLSAYAHEQGGTRGEAEVLRELEDLLPVVDAGDLSTACRNLLDNFSDQRFEAASELSEAVRSRAAGTPGIDDLARQEEAAADADEEAGAGA